MAWTPPLNLLGLVVQGDLGDLTIYTNQAGKKVFYPRTKPHDPPSLKRINQRARFRWAQATWRALTDAEKANLEAATNRCSLVMTGQNLWISCVMKNNRDGYATIARQSGLDLPPLLLIS